MDLLGVLTKKTKKSKPEVFLLQVASERMSWSSSLISSVRLQRGVNEVTFTFFFILYILEDWEDRSIPLSAIRLQMPNIFFRAVSEAMYSKSVICTILHVETRVGHLWEVVQLHSQTKKKKREKRNTSWQHEEGVNHKICCFLCVCSTVLGTLVSHLVKKTTTLTGSRMIAYMC